MVSRCRACQGGLGVLGLSYKVVWELRSGHAEIVCLKGGFKYILCEGPRLSLCVPTILVDT